MTADEHGGPDDVLASGPLGMRLLSFDRAPENSVFATAPVGYALVALWHGERLLLVLERGRNCWELPGGGIEPGETSREAAVRELWEEAGQRLAPERLRFAGHARTLLPNKKELRGALYSAEIDEPAPWRENEEIAALHWWDLNGQPPGGQLQTVDAYLARLARP
ncbi:NUDIX domain-containing protein [Streptomyces profundus]|uniref:NUDIX domain-containing protein n=1 Tax=Streptomyces profundus TaxID=2867410 RepID=UPI001D15F29B|nr:NUDIX domain-containing protein [Streptomyces sp. MA3_2.13]UED84266.1 NUDIX domain-containing protein [Streptomyces sp. MA3_2.13]